MSLTSNLIHWTELGLVPDFLVRIGIRRLCRQRLKNIDTGDCESNQRKLEAMIDMFSKGPIAPIPEAANEQHYEVPAAFFKRVLGPRRKYSCCLYSTGNETLAEAEDLSLAKTCERAELENSQNILELGCGWGSLTLWMAQKYPDAHITAVSNSHSQREFILDEAERLGVDHNLTVITCDMNDFAIDQTFDRVISVEMFEHMRNYQNLLKNVSSWLNEQGKLFVHIFAHREFTYEFQDENDSDWMSRYFFSGGIMPGDNLLSRFTDHLKIQKQWRWSGTNYHRTSEQWLNNMDRNQAEVISIFETTYGQDAKQWFHRWRLFFLAVSELFNTDSGQQWWVSHYLFEKQPTGLLSCSDDATCASTSI